MSAPLDQDNEAGARAEAALARFLSLHPKSIDLSLDRMARLLDRLGRPQDRLPPVIHVAGTNGKGSTVALIRALAEAQGLSVHAYTSPHLVRFHERIRIAGRLISDTALADVLARCEAANDGAPITFFEMTTAAALLAFSETRADLTLLEVGLGGRLDATNLVERTAVCVISPVSYDHQRFLGDTLGEIAGEKAGILRPSIPAIIGPQAAEALAVIEARAQALGAPLKVFGSDFSAQLEGETLVLEEKGTGTRRLAAPALAGPHQAGNAALAILALETALGRKLPETTVNSGLKAARWPARLQRLSPGPVTALAPGAEVWLDGAHNLQGAEALARALSAMPPAEDGPTLIMAMQADKDADGILRAFAPLSPFVICVPQQNSTAGMDAAILQGRGARAGLHCLRANTLFEAMKIANARHGLQVAAPRKRRIVICGSLYLAGAVLRENNEIPN
jgi:dihydrofolate synthase / folylpolyglutamate synthase